MTDSDVDVVVVGAGLAGLAAARDLEVLGATVLILEARDRTGGRTLNHQLENGEVVEIGGQWVGPHHDRLLTMANELEVETFPTHNRGWHLLYIGGRIRRYRNMVPPRMSPVQLIDLMLSPEYPLNGSDHSSPADRETPRSFSPPATQLPLSAPPH